MTREEKREAVAFLKEKFNATNNFYLTDSSTLTVAEVNKLRELCFKNDIELKVVKNTLAIKALEALENESYQNLYEIFKGPTAVMFAETANAPAKVIKEFRKSAEKPVLKAAYIDSDIFVGDDQVDALAALKSKEELLGDVLILLQSPMKSLISALQSGGSTISGLLKALEERGEKTS